MKFQTPIRKSFFTAVLGIALVLVAVFVFNKSETRAALSPCATPGELCGWAHSDNIGWISMNCKTGGPTQNDICTLSPYAVSISSSGVISGDAWSDNVGWIRFGGLAGFPQTPGNTQANAQYNMQSGEVSGWARALAASGQNAGGWDGWISLRGASYGVSFTGNGPVRQGAGYGWGGTFSDSSNSFGAGTGNDINAAVIGWVDFSGVTYNAPPVQAVIQLSASQTIYRCNTANPKVNLIWQSQNVAGCQAQAWTSQTTSITPTNTNGAEAGVAITNFPSSQTFQITGCTATDGSPVSSNPVTVTCTNKILLPEELGCTPPFVADSNGNCVCPPNSTLDQNGSCVKGPPKPIFEEF